MESILQDMNQLNGEPKRKGKLEAEKDPNSQAKNQQNDKGSEHLMLNEKMSSYSNMNSSTSKPLKNICLVCQDYVDHITSKCPNNRCKLCGQLGHVNRDCHNKPKLELGQKASHPNVKSCGKLKNLLKWLLMYDKILF